MEWKAWKPRPVKKNSKKNAMIEPAYFSKNTQEYSTFV